MAVTRPAAIVSDPAEARGRGTESSPSTDPITVVDLFCGAGGLALGLAQAGMEVRAHVDNWEPAIRTVNANFGEDCVPVDVASLTVPDVIELAGGKAPRVMVGGPPCQSFTSAGRRRVDDPRGSLVGMYASLAAAVRPDVVVFENVEGFVTAGGGRFVFDLLDPLIEAGYRVRLRKVNLANYGVPQHRKRVIAVASLLDEPPFPLPSHSAWGAPGAKAVAGRPPTPTLGEALAGLPEPDSPDAPTDHVVSKVGALEQARISALKPGQTMRDLPEELWHESYRRRAYRRVMDGVPTERRGGAPAGLRRLRADEPSKAVTSAAVREFIHPTQDRRLTLREVARLQTFPDHFEFIGTFSERATLVGNAVPPRFAAALGGAIREHVNAGQSETRQESREGALVEFDVTPGQQMSPALARVVSDVNARYIACSLFASLESA